MNEIAARMVLAECYGMLQALSVDETPGMREVIDTQLAQIERVMGAEGQQMRAKRLKEEELEADEFEEQLAQAAEGY